MHVKTCIIIKKSLPLQYIIYRKTYTPTHQTHAYNDNIYR